MKVAAPSSRGANPNYRLSTARKLYEASKTRQGFIRYRPSQLTSVGTQTVTPEPERTVSAPLRVTATSPMTVIEQNIHERIDLMQRHARQFHDEGDQLAPESLWEFARQVVIHSFDATPDEEVGVVTLPSISDSLDGSIDIVWEHHGRSVLISIYADDPSIAVYSAGDRNDVRDHQSGHFPTDKSQPWLITWLTQQ